MKKLIRFLVLFPLIFSSSQLYSQAPGCPNVNAGPDVNLACGGCTNLTATPFQVGTTTSYNATSVPYAPPYPFNAGTQIFVGLDDVWSDVIWLPFSFCFFGNEFTKIVVGANGLISFDVSLANQSCVWSYSASVPNSSLYGNAIFGAYHDIDPSVCGKIYYAILGAAPCRTFVVNYDAVCHYDCNSLKTTQQIVLYETTNVIEVYIQNKPTCTGWNSGNAVVGIQNANGTQGYTPAGYNTGPWSVSNMGFRFTPNGAPAYTLEWYQGTNLIATNTPTINVCPGSNTMYTAKVTYNTCNAASAVTVTDDVWVNVTGIPTGANSNSPLCAGQTLQLQSQGGYVSYQWSGPGGFTSNQQNPSIPNANASNAGVYTVTVNNGSGSCSSTITVVVNPPPTPSITGTTSICSGQSTILTASGGGTYAWNTGATTAGITVSPGATTSYTVTVTSAAGCTATASTTVTVNPLPTPSITGTNTICAGQSTTLTASGGGTYQWNTGATTAGITVSPGATTTYTVTVTNAAGCTATATRTVTVNPLPTPSITGTNTICAGQSTTLTASGGGTYQWNTGATTAGITVSPGATTTYTVTVTNAAGCTASSSQLVTVNPLPTPTAGNNGPLCTTNTLNLTSSGGGSYSWTGPGGFSSTQQNPSIPNITVANGGTYTVTVTSASGCTATASTTVTINPNLVVSASSNAPVCVGATLTLSTAGGTSYSWVGPGGFTSTQQNPSIPNATTGNSGTYTVTVTNASGCTGTASTTVTVNPLPTPSIMGINTICAGQSTTLTASGGGTYQWNTGATTAGITVSPGTSTTYTVTVSSAAGCTASSSQLVTVNPLPTPTAGNNGPLCTTNTLNLTSSGGGSYSWTGPGGFSSTQQNPSIPNITVANGGTYTVTVTSASGCTATASTTVTINPNLVVSASSNAPVCVGVTLALSTAGGTSYSWVGPGGFTSTQQNPSIPNATTGNSGTYTVTVTNASGCTGTASTTVTVNPLPTPSITGTNTICAGQSTTLTASGGGTYQWNTGATTAGITVSPGTSTTYTVTVSSAAGCTASSSQLVTVNPLPTPTAGNNGPLCTTNTLNLTSSGGGSYSWTGPGGFSSTQQNPSIPNITVANGGTYTVTVTSASGCTATASTTVTINPNLVVSASSNAPVCVGATLTLSTAGGTSYSWVGPGGFTSTQQNPSIPNATTGNSGTYTVTVTNASGCTGTASTTVTVNPLPTPSIMGINTICAGQSTTLTASGGGTYQWNTGATTAGITVSPGTSTTYTVTVSSAAGCTASSSQLVTVNPLPTPTAGNNGPLCTTNTLNLTSSGGGSYSWTGPGGFSSTQQNPSIPNITVANGGTYTVTVTDVNGCTASVSTMVVVNALPMVVAGSSGMACEGLSINLTSSGGTSYSWVGPNGFASNMQNPVLNTIDVTHAGVYTVTVTNAEGCTASSTVSVVVNPLPQANYTAVNLQGCSPVCTDFSDLSTVSSGSVTSWSWSANGTLFSNAQNPTQCFNAPGTYDVLLTVTTDQGCSTSFVINNLITVYQHPTAAFSINPEVLISDNPTANFTNNSTLDVIMWNWDFGDGSYGTVENPVHMYGDTGVYCITLTVSTANGCSSSVVNCLYIFPEYKIFIPNTFTPNDDKINDFFTVEGMGIAEFEMEIFNRWGESIYVTESMLGWPGTIGSTDVMAKQDVYVYKIRVITFQNDTFDYYGQINLIR